MSKNGNAGNGKMHKSNNNNSGSNSCNWPNRLRLSQSEGKFLMQFPPQFSFSFRFPPLLLPLTAFFFLHFAGHSEIHLAFVAAPAAAISFSFFFSLLHYTRAFSFSIFYKHFSIAFRCAFSFGVKKNPLAVSGS